MRSLVIHTDVTVCNLAIAPSSGDKIDSLDEESPLAVFCADNYPHLRDTLLAKYRWSFANQIGLLAQLAPAQGEIGPLAKKFAKPADLQGAVHAWRDRADPEGATRRFVLEANDAFWCDQSPVYVEYTAVRTEAQWPSWFRHLVVTAFASDVAAFCQRMTLSREKRVEAFGTPQENGEGGLYAQARNEDARMAPQRQLVGGVDPGPLVEARGGFGGPVFSGFRLQSQG